MADSCICSDPLYDSTRPSLQRTVEDCTIPFAIQTISLFFLCTSYIHLSIWNHHRHHHHQAKAQLGHLVTRSGLTLPDVSVTISPGPVCLLVCSSFIILSNLLQCVLFTGCNRFLLYSCTLSKTWVIFSPFGISVFFFKICPSVPCCCSHTFHLCCCYSSCISCCNGPVFTTI